MLASRMWNSVASRIDTASEPSRARSSASTWAFSSAIWLFVSLPASWRTTQPLELDADIEGVARFLPARRCHHRDPVAAQFDQAFRGQLPERVARNGAADAEPFAEQILRQFRAGLQRLLDDGAAQRAADHADLVGGFRSLAGRRAAPSADP